MSLDPTLSARTALARHLDVAGLPPDAGAGERWVKIRIGPFPFAYPNTRGRKRLLRAHDLHHVLTGYGNDLVGEAELGAWELGSGLRDRTGVRLAIRVFGFALPWHRKRLLRAFVRGRHGRNLFGAPLGDDVLDRPVAALRSELGLDRDLPEPSEEDRRAFRRWSVKALAVVWGPLVPSALVVAWLLS